MKTINIIGAGFSSLSAACYLAKAGYEVGVYEKNNSLGGRARVLEIDGFKFDMGPSWYWMPDVFERFFSDFGKRVSDYYELKRISPSYRVYYDDASYIDVPSTLAELHQLFEKEEPGSSRKLDQFLKQAEYNYNVAVKDLVYKPGLSPMELITPKTIGKINQFFTSISFDVRKRFKNEKLIKILEFPVLFLGAKAQDTPSFYSFMNYADLVLGTWYPMGGMHKVVEAMVELAKELGVKFNTNASIEKIIVDGGRATGMVVNKEIVYSDVLLSGADYHHTESLLDLKDRNYSEKFWSKKTFAPSALLFYVGFKKKLKNVSHHILFFDRDFDHHSAEIYDKPAWPLNPLFYANFPTVTDDSLAPKDKESAFFLIPLASGLKENKDLHAKYFELIINRLEQLTGQAVEKHILFKESYSISNFKEDYNSYKGNAYGMANTLKQTAFLRPKIKSKKISNLYFTGQLTVPGPGVPPALISGKIAAELIAKEQPNLKTHEIDF
ncbi:MAG TPA: phytoene desaturase [Flavobacteriales bacterium]|nr:phytoene desaturase [Flavobacteriales bacterium]